MKAYTDLGNKNFSRHGQTRLRRFLAITSAIGLMAAMMITPFMSIISSAAAAAATNSVIVVLQDDPAAVWQAKQKKAGQSISADQLAAYRGSLTGKQDQFLAALSARGISYEVSGVNVPNFDGTNAGHVDFR